MKKNYFLLILFTILTISSYAETIYVSSSETENGTGTQESPFNNLEDGFAAISSGDTLLLSGHFFRSSAVFQILGNTNNITIGVWGDEGAIIEANEDLSGIFLFVLRDLNNVTIQDITFRGSQNEETDAFWLFTIVDATDVTVNNVTFEQNWGNNGVALIISGSGENVTVTGCTLRNMGWSMDADENPQGSTPVSSGIFIRGDRNQASYNNVIVRNNTITDMVNGNAENLTLTGNIDGFTIEENNLSDNSNIGIALAGHYDIVDPDDLVTPLNPELNQARNGVVRNNTVVRSKSPIAASGGIYCDGCRDVIIEQNRLIENQVGVSIGCENGGGNSASNVQVINNIFKNNTIAGLFLGSSLNDDQDEGEELSTVENCIVRNNTFYKNGIDIDDPNAVTQGEAFIGRSNNNNFFNNIIYLDNDTFGVISFAAEDQVVENFSMDYNLFYRDNENCDNLIVSAGSLLTGNENSQFGNPEFIDTENFDILPTSRAANNGDPDTQPVMDNDGNIIEFDFDGSGRIFENTSIDIGAQESESNQVPLTPNLYGSDIIIFDIDAQQSTVINADNHTITVTMPENTDLSNLVPDIEISACDAAIDPASGIAQDFTNPFTYQVTAGNGVVQDWVVTVVETLSVSDLESLKDQIQIYPNPIKKQASIRIENEFIGNVKVGVFSLDGRSIFEEMVFEKNQITQTKSIDFQNVSDGIYILVLKINNQLLREKIIVEK